ncbi:hypothetical protein Plhal304r1_c028g0093921 [Plasmopara halstedii]
MAFIELLHVNLRQLIRHCRAKLDSPPKWFTSAQVAFDSALQGQGKGLYFLCLPLQSTTRWKNVHFYWQRALSLWSTRLLPKLMNTNPTLAVLHRKACQYLSHHGIYRISTFCVCFGSTPDSSTLREALSGSSINTTRLLTRVVDTLPPRLSVPSYYGTFIINPCPPKGILAAFHIWTFDGQDIIDATNISIRRLLKSSLPPQSPLQSLQLNGISPPINLWSALRKL